MKRTTKKRVKRIIVWLGLLIVIGIGFLLIVGNWILNRPAVQAYLQNTIYAISGAAVEWQTSVWNIPNQVILYDVSVSNLGPESSLTLHCDRVSIHSIFYGAKQVTLHSLTLEGATGPITFVSRIDLDFPDEWRLSQIRAVVESGRLDVAELLNLPTSSSGSQDAGFDPAWIESVRFNRLQVALPFLPRAYFWSGSVRPDAETRSVWFDATIGPTAGEREERISVEGRVDGSFKTLQTLRWSASRFPVELDIPAEARGVVDATGAVVLDESREYALVMDGWIGGCSIAGATRYALEIPSMRVSLGMRLDPRFQPLSATSTIVYTTAAARTSRIEPHQIPAGAMTVELNQPDRPNASIDWRIDTIGRLRAFANDTTIGATTPVQIHAAVPALEIARLAAYLPEPSRGYLDRVSGRIRLEGELSLRGFQPDRYQGVVSFSNVKYEQAGFRVRDASAWLRAQGNRQTMTAAGPVELPVAYASDAGTVFEQRVTGDVLARYDEASRQLAVEGAKIQTEMIESASAWFRGPADWALEGTLPLEEHITQLCTVWMPELFHETEGMGTLSFVLRGHGRGIELIATSEDMAVYSFSDALQFGIQLRDSVINGYWDGSMKQPVCRYEITGATPFLSYAGFEKEWSRSTLRVHGDYRPGAALTMTVDPPNGGTIQWTRHPDNRMDLRIDKVGLEELAFPVLDVALRRFGFTFIEKWDTNGSMNAAASVRSGPDQWEIEGIVEAILPFFQVESYPQFYLREGRVSVPLFYPLNDAEKTSRALEFQAAEVGWDGYTGKDIRFRIPISAESTPVARQVKLPIFGGDIQLADLEVSRWTAGSPRLSGSIELNRLQLQAINQVLPIVPLTGEVSGYIDQIDIGETESSLSGTFNLDIFKGRITARQLTMRRSIDGSRIVRFDIDLERIDLSELAAYFNFGDITGTVSGYLKNVEVFLPSARLGGMPIPQQFELEIKSDPKVSGYIGKDSLEKIVDLGETNIPLSNLSQNRFRYGAIGLRASLRGDELRILGTLPDQYFISKSTQLFTNSIGIRFPDSKKTISFHDFWNRLLRVTGRAVIGS